MGFLDQPAEMRNLIYEYCFADDVCHFTVQADGSTLWVPTGAAALPYVNRQLASETLGLLHDNVVITIRSLTGFELLLATATKRGALSRLGKIVLDFAADPSDNWDADDDDDNKPKHPTFVKDLNSAIRLCARLPRLKSLEIIDRRQDIGEILEKRVDIAKVHLPMRSNAFPSLQVFRLRVPWFEWLHGDATRDTTAEDILQELAELARVGISSTYTLREHRRYLRSYNNAPSLFSPADDVMEMSCLYQQLRDFSLRAVKGSQAGMRWWQLQGVGPFVPDWDDHLAGGLMNLML